MGCGVWELGLPFSPPPLPTPHSSPCNTPPPHVPVPPASSTAPRRTFRSRRSARGCRACRRWRSSNEPSGQLAVGDASAALDGSAFLHDPPPILPQPCERRKRAALDGEGCQ